MSNFDFFILIIVYKLMIIVELQLKEIEDFLK